MVNKCVINLVFVVVRYFTTFKDINKNSNKCGLVRYIQWEMKNLKIRVSAHHEQSREFSENTEIFTLRLLTYSTKFNVLQIAMLDHTQASVLHCRAIVCQLS